VEPTNWRRRAFSVERKSPGAHRYRPPKAAGKPDILALGFKPPDGHHWKSYPSVIPGNRTDSKEVFLNCWNIYQSYPQQVITAANANQIGVMISEDSSKFHICQLLCLKLEANNEKSELFNAALICYGKNLKTASIIHYNSHC